VCRPQETAVPTPEQFRYIVEADGLLSAFLELQRVTRFERELPAFSRRHDLVHTMSGCRGFDEEVGRVAKRIASIMYDPLITRPPW
jgi:hypothetical protein